MMQWGYLFNKRFFFRLRRDKNEYKNFSCYLFIYFLLLLLLVCILKQSYLQKLTFIKQKKIPIIGFKNVFLEIQNIVKIIMCFMEDEIFKLFCLMLLISLDQNQPTWLNCAIDKVRFKCFLFP